MPHEIGCMSMMEHPTQRLGEHIRRIDHTRQMNQDYIPHESPVLKCEVPNFDVTRAISRSVVIDDLDSRIVVFVNGCRLRLSITQLVKNESKVLGDFRSCIGSDQLCLSLTLSTY